MLYMCLFKMGKQEGLASSRGYFFLDRSKLLPLLKAAFLEPSRVTLCFWTLTVEKSLDFLGVVENRMLSVFFGDVNDSDVVKRCC